MKFIPIGVGDAFSALYYSFCIAVGFEDQWLLIDCPHPIRKMLREASVTSGVALDVDRFRCVVQTHLHADHCSGLEGFGYYRHFVTGQRARILIHPKTEKDLWDGHLKAGMCQLIDAESHEPHPHEYQDFFQSVALDETKAVKEGPFVIECRQTIHHIPTFALRISAGGKTLGISSDTAFDPSLIAWLDEADLIIHETNFGAHTPYEKLAALPKAVRQKMRLIHYPDSFDIRQSVILALSQGQVVEL